MLQNYGVLLADYRVAKSAKMLDEALPDWFQILDLSNFEMASASCCVIGQLAEHDMERFKEDLDAESYFGYTQGLRALADELEIDFIQFEYQYGFTIPGDGEEGFNEYTFAQLQEAWIEQIQSRREAAKHGRSR
jgi:hypothetical protein